MGIYMNTSVHKHAIFCEIMWKNIVVLDWPQMTIWCALHAGYQRYKNAWNM